MYCRIYIFSSLILLFMILTVYGDDDYYLVSTARETARDLYGRKWQTLKDIKVWGKYIWSSTAEGANHMTGRTPFLTAAISDTLFSFRFPIKQPGRKYVRLYFYTQNYHRHYHVLHNSGANFSVIANSEVLLDFPNSRIFYPEIPSFNVVEFSIPVVTDHLTLLLAPSYDYQNSFAFINGIEIVSHPDYYSGPVTLVGITGKKSFILHSQKSLQTIARLNVGGEDLSILDDTRQQFRSWYTDERFLGSGLHGNLEDAVKHNMIVTYPPDIYVDFVAPLEVYRTGRSLGTRNGENKNSKMTWRIPVDSEYYYFVRLHFCEVTGRINEVNDRLFNIYINGYEAESGFDVVHLAEQPGVSVYKDYVVFVRESAEPEVRVTLAPDVSSHTKYYDTLLNGLEVFKISDCNGDLDENHDPRPRFGMQKRPIKCSEKNDG